MKRFIFFLILVVSTSAFGANTADIMPQDTTPVNTLKTWFSKGKKPTEAQFHSWLDSYRHLSDALGLGDVTGLVDSLVVLRALAESGGISDGDKGDITVSSGTFTIDNDAVTLAKQASGTPNRLQVFDASGNPAEGNVTGNATLVAGVLNVTGDGTGTDDQKIDTFELVGSTFRLSMESDGEATKEVDLSGLLTSTTFDILETGQSNAVVRDVNVGDWTYTIDSNIYAITNAGEQVIWVPDSLNWQTGDTDPSSDSIRNNIAWQFAKQYRVYNPSSPVRIVSHATGSRASWYWTPKTSGPGEGGTSNALLTGVIGRLDSAPADFNARVIIFPQGENDDSDGFMRFWINNVTEIYDTLTAHSKVADDAVFLISYPDCDNSTFDSLRMSIDSLIEHTRNIGNRNIIGVKFCINGFDNIHFTNEQVTEVGRYYYSNYVEGWANQAGETTPTGWQVVGSNVQLENTSNNVTINNDVTIDEAAGGWYALTAIRRDDTEMARFQRKTAAGAEVHSIEIVSGTAASNSGFWIDYKNAGIHNNMMRFYPGGLDFENSSYADVLSINYTNGYVTAPTRLVTGYVSGTAYNPINISETSTPLYNIGRPAVHRLSLLNGSGTGNGGGLLETYDTWNGSAWVNDHGIRRYAGGLYFVNSALSPVVQIDFTTGSLGVGGTPSPSSLFSVTSITKGSRPAPSMTTAQRDAILSPVAGLCVYNTTTNFINYYDGTAWRQVASQNYVQSNFFQQGGNSFSAAATIGTNDDNNFILERNNTAAVTIGTGGSLTANAYTSSSAFAGTTSHFVTQNSSGQLLTKSASTFRQELNLYGTGASFTVTSSTTQDTIKDLAGTTTSNIAAKFTRIDNTVTATLSYLVYTQPGVISATHTYDPPVGLASDFTASTDVSLVGGGVIQTEVFNTGYAGSRVMLVTPDIANDEIDAGIYYGNGTGAPAHPGNRYRVDVTFIYTIN